VAHLAEILAALKWQTVRPGLDERRRQVYPAPATWLNDRCWEDEPTKTVNGASRDITKGWAPAMTGHPKGAEDMNTIPTRFLDRLVAGAIEPSMPGKRQERRLTCWCCQEVLGTGKTLAACEWLRDVKRGGWFVTAALLARYPRYDAKAHARSADVPRPGGRRPGM